MQKQRLFIISNRLPINIESSESEFEVKPSSGGLVTAISSYLKNANPESYQFSKTFWIGAPGCDISTWEKAQNEIDSSEYNYLPVFINNELYDSYYNGFSNSMLWPLFHYFPSYAEFDIDYFEDYMKVNREFLSAVLKNARENDIIWIHDYHLLPLAGMIRKEFPDITIGFFLHIPFPSYELMRLLPKKWQQELMNGMLGADLIGFHTIDYASHFLECARMILGLENDMHIISHQNRLIKADVFPIGIDFDCFNNAYDNKTIASMRHDMKEQFQGKKIIFSVDRLDYTKGLSHRLKGYEHFLLNNPSYYEKVVFILVIVPSRDNITKYAERKKMIDEHISNINSQIGNIHWQPVIYQYNSLEFEEMLALYTGCDLALITPLRDGMNLVAKEFVASRKDKRGVLVLSDMAGAARELTDALTINPNDTQEMSSQIKTGLEMSSEEQGIRMENMQSRLSYYDVNAWADDFFMQLKNIKKKQLQFKICFLDEAAKRNVFDKYRSTSHRLLLLDYDGTLSTYASLPSKAKPNQDLLDLLNKLGSNPQNVVYIISGRDSKTLESWFSDLPINIIAEHGARTKLKNKEWQTEVIDGQEWKPQIKRLMEMYVKRCANSFIEEKEFSVVWHYRNANAEQGKLRAFELFSELNEYTHNLNLNSTQGNKILEVRNQGIDKGGAVRKVLLKKKFDFILAAGDDRTDEDMFKLLADKDNANTIKIGNGASYAKYNLHTPQMVISLLDAMSYLQPHNKSKTGYKAIQSIS